MKGLFRGGKEGRGSPLGGLGGVHSQPEPRGREPGGERCPRARFPREAWRGGPAPGSALARCPHTWFSGSRRPAPLGGGEDRGSCRPASGPGS